MTGTYQVIVSPDDRPNFWKPVAFGEVLVGKLLAITQTSKSPVLQIQLFSGEIVQVGVTTQLQRVDWADYLKKDLRITYKKTVPSRYGNPTKLFLVEVAG